MSKNIFNHSNPFTLGVEEAHMICNPMTGDLINRANEIMDSLPVDLKKDLVMSYYFQKLK